MANVSLIGKRYVNLLRASTNMQDTSIADQKMVNDKHAQDKLGMLWVGDVKLQGVSGCKTFNRRDIKELLERRRVLKNYDVIVVYDSSRLTRGGAAHAFAVRRDFAKVGVLVLSVMDPIPEGDFAVVIQTVIDTQNHLAAKKISGFITRGIYSAVKNGDVGHHGAAPYGIDRLYFDTTETPTLRLRYLPGARRQLINESNQNVLKDLKRGEEPIAAHLMARGEKVRLVPGNAKMVEAIQDAFRLRYRHGWGYTRIAKYFVSKGVYPLRSMYWHDSGIRDILMNPIYLGWNYFLQMKTGLHFNAGANGPEERHINQEELEDLERLSVPRERRPVCEMLPVTHPYLSNLITDADVRQAADTTIRQYFADWHLRHTRVAVKNHNSQPKSRYFLRDVLRDKHYNRKFCGLTHGRDGDYRDYICNDVIELEPRERKLPTNIRAEPLERAVIEILKHAFSNMENLELRLQALVRRVLAEQPDEIEKAVLETELTANKNRIKQFLRSFTAEELKENDDVIRESRANRERIEARLSVCAAYVKLDPAKLVDGITETLRTLEVSLAGSKGSIAGNESGLAGGFEELRMLLKIACPRVVIDLETAEAEVFVALPASILYAGSSDWRMMCCTSTQQEWNIGGTHQEKWAFLGSYALTPVLKQPKPVRRGFSRRHDISHYIWADRPCCRPTINDESDRAA